MNVGQLIAILKVLPHDVDVIIQKEVEGARYSEISGTELGSYIAKNSSSGEFASSIEISEMSDLEKQEYYNDPTVRTAIVIY